MLRFSDIRNVVIFKDNELDLLATFRMAWVGRKLIFLGAVIFFALGAMVAFLSEEKYESSVTILPVAEKKSGGMGSLSSIAGFAGINLNSLLGSGDEMSGDLYVDLVFSLPIMYDLLHSKFYWQKYDKELSFIEVEEARPKSSFGDFLIKYTIGLPGTLKEFVSPAKVIELPKMGSHGGQMELYSLNKTEIKVLKSLLSKIAVEYDKKKGTVTITSTMPEPVLSAQVANKVMQLLQKRIIEYKTNKSQQFLDFVQQRFNETKSDYEQNQRAFLEFKDSHRNLIAERADLEYMQLSDKYDLSSAIFKSIANQLEQAKISVKEETPSFSVLNPAVVPFDRSSPKRVKLMMMFAFGGFIISYGVLIAYSLYSNADFIKK